MTEADFIFLENGTNKPVEGTVSWISPSNIALVKYWGKTEPQIPKNASISFTLNNCNTKTSLSYSPREDPSADFEFKVYFEGVEKPSFQPKISDFFSRIATYVPFVRDYKFEINTENSFPHSSGIASSASGMSALALCLMGLQRIIDPRLTDSEFFTKASFLARLGSGSASRSISGPLVVWGQHPQVYGSNDLYGVPYPGEVHDVFRNFHDTILLVDKGVKKVSSSLGHKLMLGHPFAEARFVQAQDNLSRMIPILRDGDLNGFIDLVEKEALSLHAMMLTSDPYFVLMKPNTLKVIEAIWNFRKKSGCHLCFTLDAGANVHVLFPQEEQKPVLKFIENHLARYCQNKQYINDKVGSGAREI